MDLEGYETPFIGADAIDDGEDLSLPPEWAERHDESLAAVEDEPADGDPEEVEEPADEETTDEEPADEEAPDEESDEVVEDTDEGTDADEAEDEEAPDESEAPSRTQEHRVPKSRLDKEIQKRRAAEQQRQAAEQQLAELRRQLDRGPATQDPEPAAADDGAELMAQAYTEALNKALDGDVAGASALMMEAQAKREAQLKQQLSTEVRKFTTQEQLQQELDLVTESLESRFEDLRPDSDSYDEALVDEIIAVRDGFMMRGKMRPGQALEKAAKLVLRDRLVEAEPEVEAAPAPKPKPKPKDLKKKIDAAKRQPPQSGQRSPETRSERDGPDIFSMTEEDFENLSEAELRRLRGDFR